MPEKSTKAQGPSICALLRLTSVEEGRLVSAGSHGGDTQYVPSLQTQLFAHTVRPTRSAAVDLPPGL